ncbi:MAG: type II toxin-antitoxin system RelE/ParE family toxin [Kofleriaceae bacterium]|nr:type II toxin-antitoxin system RelE/ParE family toxin [Candidatus Methylomirabilis lanthanidiphila]
MIKSFGNEETERVFRGLRSRRLSAELRSSSARKLLLLNAAESLAELRVPPGNRLEKLKGDRARQHSIRINDRWRICFVWRDGDAYDVEITDYHS